MPAGRTREKRRKAMRRDLYGMFYPLEKHDQDEWGEIVRLPTDEYLLRVADKAAQFDCRQENTGEVIRWIGRAGNLELMLFRIPDPGDLDAVRRVFETLEQERCPLAFAFVNQRGDHPDAWDVFHFSRLSYLCHGNRIAGPGAECEA
jgi:hypothetical protein